MNVAFYFLVPDIIILIVVIKAVFKSADEFPKAVADHFHPDDLLPNPLNEWSEKTDAKHKIDIVYAAVLGLAIINFVLYYFLFV